MLEYSVTDPVEGETVSAECKCDWVVLDVQTPGEISIDAASNDNASPRKAEVTVSYPGAEQKVFTISQAGLSDDPGTDEGFSLTVKNIEYVSASLDVIPQDKDMYYVIFYVDAEYAEEYSDDEKLFEADMEFFKMVSEMYQETLEETIIYYSSRGDCLDYEMISLYPSSDYVAYVYGIDPATATRLTDIERVSFSTLEVEMIDASFSFDVKVNGPSVNVTVTPEGYDGYYRIELFQEKYFHDVDMDEAVFDSWMELIGWYLDYNYTAEELIAALCVQGTQTISKDLTYESDYIVIAFAVNDDAFLCSKASYEIFRTGDVEKSDNEISLSLGHVGSRKAQVTVSTTNSDPYALVVMESKFLDKFTTDDEVAEYCIEYSRITPMTGNVEKVVSNLAPETRYSLVAFGYYGKVKTTDKIARVDFTTEPASDSEITGVLTWKGYYDSKAVAELDAVWAPYASEDKCFVPVSAETVPADGTVYYKFYECETLERPEYTDEMIISELLSLGSKDKFTVMVAPYDTEMIAVCIAQDADGNYGPLWKGDKFILTIGDVSDPQEFLDSLPKVESAPEVPGRQIRKTGGFSDGPVAPQADRQISRLRHLAVRGM